MARSRDARWHTACCFAFVSSWIVSKRCLMDHLVSASIRVGDPAPWFSAPTITGGSADLQVSGGRWVVISFLGDLAAPRAEAERQSLIGCIEGATEDHLVAY